VSIVVVDEVASFDDVFRDHYGKLVRVLSAAGPGAEDAVAEAFSLALVKWRRVGGYDDPVAWIRRAAVHRMLNERRRLRRREAALPRLIEVAPRGPDDVVPELAAAVQRLPRQQRIALVLKVLADLDTDEVAESMGISTGAVRYHLHEARQRLRAELGAIDDV
jgi:RNA polymerase sigma-70 factor (ECF subfamily)